MKKLYRLTALAAISALAFVPSAFADGLPGAPAPFDKGGVKLALISYISAGDFFQAYQAGAEAQAKALGVDLRVFPGASRLRSNASKSCRRSISVFRALWSITACRNR